MTIYQAAWYFIIFSFLGWCVEVVFHAVTQGKVINRGFLCGPVCPIYGTGVLSVLFFVEYLLPSFKGWLAANGNMPDARIPEIIVLFLFGMFAASLAELVTGWTLDKIFHERWWDYSDRPFNFHGYICPLFSILWGLAIVFVVRVMHPFIAAHTAEAIPERIGWPILAVLGVFYLADIVVTVAIVRGLNKKISELDEMRANMRIVSDHLTDRIGKGSLRTAQRIEGGQVQAALAKAELAERIEESKAEAAAKIETARAEAGQRHEARSQAFDERLDRAEAAAEAWFNKQSKLRTYMLKRIIKAFPAFELHEHKESLSDLKNYIETHWNGPRD